MTGVAAGVAGPPVREQFQEYRPLAAAALGNGGPSRLVDSQDVVAVDCLAPDPVARGPVGDLLHPHHLVHAGRCPVQVVLADEEDGEVPDGRQVDSLVKGPLGHGAVAEEAGDHARLLPHLEREGHA